MVFDAANLSPVTDLKSAVVCPLFNGEALIGCLALYHTEPGHYHDDHRRLLERVAEQAGTVIHNSIVFEQAQEDSLTDPLTSLPNRRSMFAHLSRELSRAERLKTNVALIVMDVDGFKRINDTFGHHVGDHALRVVADALRAGLRSYDLCVRYAGDEFIVVLSDCSRETAEAKRHELQQRVGEIGDRGPGRPEAASRRQCRRRGIPVRRDSVETLLAEADHRMYRDKTARKATLPAVGNNSSPEVVEAEVFVRRRAERQARNLRIA